MRRLSICQVSRANLAADKVVPMLPAPRVSVPIPVAEALPLGALPAGVSITVNTPRGLKQEPLPPALVLRQPSATTGGGGASAGAAAASGADGSLTAPRPSFPAGGAEQQQQQLPLRSARGSVRAVLVRSGSCGTGHAAAGRRGATEVQQGRGPAQAWHAPGVAGGARTPQPFASFQLPLGGVGGGSSSGSDPRGQQQQQRPATAQHRTASAGGVVQLASARPSPRRSAGPATATVATTAGLAAPPPPPPVVRSSSVPGASRRPSGGPAAPSASSSVTATPCFGHKPLPPPGGVACQPEFPGKEPPRPSSTAAATSRATSRPRVVVEPRQPLLTVTARGATGSPARKKTQLLVGLLAAPVATSRRAEAAVAGTAADKRSRSVGALVAEKGSANVSL